MWTRSERKLYEISTKNRTLFRKFKISRDFVWQNFLFYYIKINLILSFQMESKFMISDFGEIS
jgi:hypothetical protein